MIEVKIPLGGQITIVEETESQLWSVGLRSAPLASGDEFRRVLVDRQTLTDLAYACLGEALGAAPRSTLRTDDRVTCTMEGEHTHIHGIDGRVRKFSCGKVSE